MVGNKDRNIGMNYKLIISAKAEFFMLTCAAHVRAIVHIILSLLRYRRDKEKSIDVPRLCIYPV